jgi:glutamine amidotransferase
MSILLINSEVSNIGSWKKILNDNKLEFVLSSNKNLDKKKIKKIIFPGVGNFGKVIDNIKKNKLDHLLLELLLNEKIKYLGVCVGMQILFENSEESNIKGLGIIKGSVKKLNFKNLTSTHNGWNNISIINKNSKIINNIDQKKDFYFNHSYFCDVENKANIISTLKGNKRISTIIEQKNIYGTQFHPEKSHTEGLKLIKSFLSI